MRFTPEQEAKQKEQQLIHPEVEQSIARARAEYDVLVVPAALPLSPAALPPQSKVLELDSPKTFIPPKLPQQLVDRRFKQSVRTFCALPEGKLAASSDEGVIRIWDLQTGTCVTTLDTGEGVHRYDGTVMCMMSLSDDKLVTCQKSHTTGKPAISIWNIKTGTLSKTILGLNLFRENAIFSLHPYRDNKIFIGLKNGLIKIIDLESETCLKTLVGHNNGVFDFHLTSDKKLISLGHDYKLKRWDIETGKCLNTYTNPRTGFKWVVMHDTKLLEYVYTQIKNTNLGDITLRVWDLDTFKCESVTAIKGVNHFDFRVMKLLPGNRIAVASYTKSCISIFDLHTGQQIQTLPSELPSENHLSAFSLYSNQQVLVCGFENGEIRVLPTSMIDVSRQEAVKLCDADAALELFDDKTVEVESTTQTAAVHNGRINCVELLSNGQFATAADDGLINIFYAENNALLPIKTINADEPPGKGGLGGVLHLVLLSNKRLLSVQHCALKFWEWDSTPPHCSKTISNEFHTQLYYTYAIELSVNQIAVGTSVGDIMIFDINSGLPIKTISGHDREIIKLYRLPGGNLLSMGRGIGDDKAIMMWDVNTGVCAQTQKGELYGFLSYLRPDGILFGAPVFITNNGGSNSFITSWNLITGERNKMVFLGVYINCMALLPDNRIIFDASQYLRPGVGIGALDYESGTFFMGNAENTEPCQSELSCIRALSNERVVTGSTSGVLRVWNLSSLKPQPQRPDAPPVPDGYMRFFRERQPIMRQPIKSMKVEVKHYLRSTLFPNGNIAIHDQDEIKVFDPEMKNLLITLPLKNYWGARHMVALSDRLLAWVELNMLERVEPNTNTIKVWDIQASQFIYTINSAVFGNNSISSMLKLTENTVAIGVEKGAIKIIDLKNGTCLKTLTGHSDAALDIIRPGLTNQLISVSGDQTIKFWDIARGCCTKTYKFDHRGSCCELVSPTQLAYVTGDGKRVVIIDVNTQATLKEIVVFNHMYGGPSVFQIKLIAEGKLAIGSSDGTVKVWDISANVCIMRFKVPYSNKSNAVVGIEVLPGNRLLSRTHDYINLWDVSMPVSQPLNPPDRILKITPSPALNAQEKKSAIKPEVSQPLPHDSPANSDQTRILRLLVNLIFEKEIQSRWQSSHKLDSDNFKKQLTAELVKAYARMQTHLISVGEKKAIATAIANALLADPRFIETGVIGEDVISRGIDAYIRSKESSPASSARVIASNPQAAPEQPKLVPSQSPISVAPRSTIYQTPEQMNREDYLAIQAMRERRLRGFNP